jgi:general stress protein 26
MLSHTMSQNQTADRDKLWELIKDIKFGMLTTRHADGHLHSRPMTTQNAHLDDDRALWLFMSRQSDSAADLQASPAVCMSYADTDDDSYVCVSGSAVASEDAAKKQALWSPMAKAWFPGGVDDPDLLLVRLDIEHADYWDVKESKIVQLWRMAAAAVTGKPPVDLGERGHVEVR